MAVLAAAVLLLWLLLLCCTRTPSGAIRVIVSIVFLKKSTRRCGSNVSVHKSASRTSTRRSGPCLSGCGRPSLEPIVLPAWKASMGRVEGRAPARARA